MKEISSRPILRRIIPAKISLHVLFALVLAFIIPVRTAAQDYYPVHATVQVLPPYSLYLSDYSNGFRDRLVITLYNRDLQQQTLDCRLRLRISNTSGFCIESRDEVPQRSITVEPNVPLRLTSQDIAPYLQTGNVKQTGTLRNGRLPEGMMTFSVQVVEQHTGRILSPWASGRAWLETKKPPMLVMPEKDETIAFTDPQHILFRWYPQHLGLSGVEYELHIRKMLDNCQNPAAQYDSGVEVFTTKTRQTLYNYSNIDPELIPGHTYAWRVRAVAMDGIDEVGVFDNDGYSETGWFRLVRGCDAPVIDRAEAGYRKLDLGWHGSADDMRYTVQYSAEKENGSYNWTDTTTIDNETTLYGLTPGATYSYRVGALCSATGKPVYSQIGTVQIPNRDSISAANCGVAPVYKELSKERKTDLKVGDRVTVGGDYTMLITELNNKGNGVYGGKGRLTFTWVFFVGLEVTFDDLVVNTDGYQIDGTVNTVYDGTNTNIANLDQLSDGGVNNRESRMSADGRSTVMDFSVPPMPRSDLSEDGGSVVVYDLSGAPHTIEIPSNGNGGQSIPFSLTDIDGNTWRFESCDSVVTDPATGGQKTVHGITMSKLDAVSGFSKDKLSDKVKARIAFMNGGQYAFDNLSGRYYSRSSKLGKDYLDKSGLGDGTYAPWKLVPMGKSDKIKAGLNPTKIDIDIASVRFVDADGHDLESSYDSDNAVWTVSLTAAATEGNYYNVYAVAKPKDGKGSYQTIGKLFVVSYKTTKADIVLLPVEKHNSDISELGKQVSGIFAPCGVEVSITESDALVGNTGWDLNGDGKLSLTNDAETDNVKRSAEMKALEDIVKSMPGYDKNVLYLVYVPNGSKSADVDVEGNWGRGRQIGYVFGRKLEVRTVAHEVGHAFTLQHTFDRQYGGNETRGKTENLMDYPKGTQLDAFQWEILAHNAPKIVASVVDGAEDNWFAGRTWVTPNGRRFRYDNSKTIAPSSLTGNHLGAIWGIVAENDKAYVWSTAHNRYCYNEDPNDYLHIESSNSNVVFLYNPTEGGCGTFYSGDWAYVSKNYKDPDFKNKNLKKEGNVECVAEITTDVVGKIVLGDNELANNATLKSLVRNFIENQAKKSGNESVYKKIKFYVTEEDKLNVKEYNNVFATGLKADIYKKGDEKCVWMWITFNYTNDGKVDTTSFKLYFDKTIDLIERWNTPKEYDNDAKKALKKFLYSIDKDFVKFSNNVNKEITNEVYDNGDAIVAFYHLSVLLSDLLEHFIIPETFWNSCKYGNVIKTPSVVEKIIKGKDFFEAIFRTESDIINKNKIPVICGCWNGVVQTIQSVPDVVSLLTCGASPSCFENTKKKVSSFLDMEMEYEGDTIRKNEYFRKACTVVKMAYNDATKDTCSAAYTVGNIIAPIAACAIGDCEAACELLAGTGSVGKALVRSLKFLSWCDKVNDMLDPVTNTFRFGKLIVVKGKEISSYLTAYGRRFARIFDDGQLQLAVAGVDGNNIIINIKNGIDDQEKEVLDNALSIVQKGAADIHNRQAGGSTVTKPKAAETTTSAKREAETVAKTTNAISKFTKEQAKQLDDYLKDIFGDGFTEKFRVAYDIVAKKRKDSMLDADEILSKFHNFLMDKNLRGMAERGGMNKFLNEMFGCENLSNFDKGKIKRIVDKFKVGTTTIDALDKLISLCKISKKEITGIKFEGVIIDGKLQRYDVCVETGGLSLHYIETKNYSNCRIFFKSGEKVSPVFKQFKTYLSAIDSFDQLVYLLQKRSNVNAEGVIDNLKKAIAKDAKAAFDANPELWRKVGVRDATQLSLEALNANKKFNDAIKNIIKLTD